MQDNKSHSQYYVQRNNWIALFLLNQKEHYWACLVNEITSIDLVTSYSFLIIFPSKITQDTFWKMSAMGFVIQKIGCMTKILTDWYIKCSVYEKFVGRGRIHSVRPIFKDHNS